MQEKEWKHLTESIIEDAFGSSSTAMNKFRQANLGAHSIDDPFVFPALKQQMFARRIEEYTSLLPSLIETLRLQLPEEKTQGVYGPGDEYKFYRDLSALVKEAENGVFIVDPYLAEEVFNLYVDKVPAARDIFILSANLDSNILIVAEKYARKRSLELRTSKSIHDRVIFIDSRVWVIGQSIKDAAHKKPTYLVELPQLLATAVQKMYKTIWEGAAVQVTSSPSP